MQKDFIKKLDIFKIKYKNDNENDLIFYTIDNFIIDLKELEKWFTNIKKQQLHMTNSKNKLDMDNNYRNEIDNNDRLKLKVKFTQKMQ